jgi:hypothetical protein
MTRLRLRDISDLAVQPFSKQKTEPDRWFHAFQEYLALGPSRSMRGAWRVWSGRRGKADSPSGAYQDNAAKWQWRARALAADRFELLQADAILSAKRRAARRARIERTARLLEAADAAAADVFTAERLKTLDPEALSRVYRRCHEDQRSDLGVADPDDEAVPLAMASLSAALRRSE